MSVAILVDGDSVAAGYATGTPWIGQVSAYSTAIYGGGISTYANVAVPGYQLSQMLLGGAGFNDGTHVYQATGSLASKLAANAPACVCLQTGINDAVAYQGGALTLAQYKNYLRQYISQVLALPAPGNRQCQMLLISDNFCHPANATPTPASQDAINLAMCQIAAEYGGNPYFQFVDIYQTYRVLGGNDSLLAVVLGSDKIHPNATGEKMIASTVAASLGFAGLLGGYAATADLTNPPPVLPLLTQVDLATALAAVGLTPATPYVGIDRSPGTTAPSLAQIQAALAAQTQVSVTIAAGTKGLKAGQVVPVDFEGAKYSLVVGTAQSVPQTIQGILHDGGYV